MSIFVLYLQKELKLEMEKELAGAPQRLFLVGFMGCGKSTVGRRLARALHWQFVDTDAFVENRHCRSVSQLFAEYGEARFRAMEQRALAEVVDYERVVVATGGGLPCFGEAMSLMNARGLTIYLRCSVDSLADHLLHARVERPLMKGKSPAELRTAIAEMLAQREPFYTQAALTVDVMPDFAHVDTILRHLQP